MRAVSCPSCGAPKSLHNPGVVMYVCEYCNAVIYLSEQGVREAGSKSQLTEGFSRLYRDATGRYHQQRFRVLGRVRYAYDRGMWDEWFLELNRGKTAWITEDQHELSVQKEIAFPGAAAFENHSIGQRIFLNESQFAVQEVGIATCIGLEGSLPKQIQMGETYPYVDATSLDGHYSLGLEFDGPAPTAFLGRWLKYAELKLDDEGEDW